MKSGIIRLLSLLMTAVILTTAFGTVSFARESGNVVASGFCGESTEGETGQNLTWTYYDTKELVISGTGMMEYYYTAEENQEPQPWHDYLSEVETITVEDGVYMISPYAFRLEDDYEGPMALKRVNIAKSVVNLSVDAFYNRAFTASKPVIVYEGTQNDWERMNWFIGHYGYFYRENHHEFKPFELFFENKAPESYCTIKSGLGGENNYVYEDVNLIFDARYYMLNSDERLEWKLEGSGEITDMQTDFYGVPTRVTVSGYDRGNSVLTVQIVNGDGKVVASDSVNLTSLKIAKGDSLKTAFDKLGYMVSNVLASAQLGGVYWLIYFSEIFNAIGATLGMFAFTASTVLAAVFTLPVRAIGSWNG